MSTNNATHQSIAPAFADLNYRRLHEVVRQLYAARFRKKPAQVFVEFESAGRWYRVPVSNNQLARNILGELWCHSHHEKGRDRRKQRRVKYAELMRSPRPGQKS